MNNEKFLLEWKLARDKGIINFIIKKSLVILLISNINIILFKLYYGTPSINIILKNYFLALIVAIILNTINWYVNEMKYKKNHHLLK